MSIRTMKPCGVGLLFMFLGLSISSGEETVESLTLQLNEARARINQLEEDLFVATDGMAMEEQEAAEDLADGIYPWSAYMRRTPMGILSLKTSTIPKGSFYGRFSHVSRNQLFTSSGDDVFHDMLGLEAGVKVGILFGYGLSDKWDVTVQRTNGKDYIVDDATFESASYDLWDVMTKTKLLDEYEDFVDLSAACGFTYFWQSDDRGEFSVNMALLAEKSVWRFRMGTGILYSSLSDFSSVSSSQPGVADDKRYVNDALPLPGPLPVEHTIAVPVNLSFALTPSLQAFGEVVFPVGGYETGNGPSAAAGCRITTHSHAYSLFFSNTANNSFNSTLTGGYRHDRLDVFGFDISIFF